MSSEKFSKLFTAVRPARGFEDIVAQIEQAVLEGRLKPGDRLPNERELGGVFDVSRPTLREALRVLEATGVVEIRRGTHGGAFVVEPNPGHVSSALEAFMRFRGATIKDLAEFRVTFESETAYWAALRATDEQVTQLQAIVKRLQDVVDAEDTVWETVANLDISFHEAVAFASQNQIRVAIMLAIHGAMQKSSSVIGNVDSLTWRLQQLTELKAIVDAIARHDADEARASMQKHVSQNVEVGVEEDEKSHQ